jgi:glyoxylase-like metal-dependent hydrolase (beta-lactamase superfamily II)
LQGLLEIRNVSGEIIVRIYHLNCGSLLGKFPRVEAIIYCLLLETDHGLVFVDTGIGRQDYEKPSRIMLLFQDWVGLRGDMKETAAFQLEELGYRVSDVTDVVLTHLHLDHDGGLPDFPSADVHIYHEEYAAGMDRRGLMARAYDPTHWQHGPRWIVHEQECTDWYGLPSLKIWEGRKPEIRLIPLHGHTRGHCGVAIRTDHGWLLQCGDAASPYHPASDIHGLKNSQHKASWLPRWFVHRFLGGHAPKLKALLRDHGDEIEAVSAHDIYSFKLYTQSGNESDLPRLRPSITSE